MKTIGVITGNLRQHQTGMSTYSFHILKGIQQKYDVHQIMDSTGDLEKGCRQVIPKTLPIPYNYLPWSITLSLQKKVFSRSDIIHNICQYPINPSYPKKSIITIYDLIPVLYPSLVTPVYAWQSRVLLPRILKKTSRILAISEHTKSDLVKRYNLDPETIDVTPLGVSDHFHPCNQQEVKQYRQRMGLLDPYILFVGALEPKKNIPGILKAFSLCLKEFPDLKLVLAGKLSWKYKDIFNLIKDLKIEKQVMYLDFVPYEELPLLYSGAEVFVFPSQYEGFGLPPLEAMKCGTPVIVSNQSSLPEIVGSEGLMVTPDDYVGLSHKILTILLDQSFRSHMSHYYLKRSNLFSWENCIKKTTESYEKVLIH